jgi:hypothetical protein
MAGRGRPRKEPVIAEIVPPDFIKGNQRKLPPSLRDLLRAKKHIDDPLQDFVMRVVGGKEAVFALLERSTHDSDAVRILKVWKQIAPTGKKAMQKYSAVEWTHLLEACEMECREFIGVVARCGWDINYDIARSIFAMKYPRLMEASMEKAIHGDSVEREKMHFVAAGHVPGPRGIQIGIVNNNRQSEPEDVTPVRPGRLPSFRSTARDVVRDLPPAQLPPKPGE